MTKVKAAQWSFQVLEYDKNYKNKDGTINKFVDFDPDQNW